MNNLALISLRNDHLNDRNETRDSIDTAIYDLISEMNLIPLLVPNTPAYTNDLENIFNIEDVKCVLFSGGNDLNILNSKGAKNICITRDQVELNLIEFCKRNDIPIIGICRGFQLIANYLGANINKIEGHINVIHEVTMIENFKNIQVNSFHSFGLKNNNLPPNIKPLAYYIEDNTIECFRTITPFRSLNFMWHPERFKGGKIDSIELIKNYLKF